MQISETILLIATTAITAVSALFCIIALATPRWSLVNGLFCDYCPTSSAGLSVVAFILLVFATVVLILLITKILTKSIRILPFALLFLATIFTLAAYASYGGISAGYSYKLMVVAHVLCYIASLFVAFWIGGLYASMVTQEG